MEPEAHYHVHNSPTIGPYPVPDESNPHSNPVTLKSILILSLQWGTGAAYRPCICSWLPWHTVVGWSSWCHFRRTWAPCWYNFRVKNNCKVLPAIAWEFLNFRRYCVELVFNDCDLTDGMVRWKLRVVCVVCFFLTKTCTPMMKMYRWPLYYVDIASLYCICWHLLWSGLWWFLYYRDIWSNSPLYTSACFSKKFLHVTV
jgi:hypothetical protein